MLRSDAAASKRFTTLDNAGTIPLGISCQVPWAVSWQSLVQQVLPDVERKGA